jgi:hypothetical protein
MIMAFKIITSSLTVFFFFHICVNENFKFLLIPQSIHALFRFSFCYIYVYHFLFVLVCNMILMCMILGFHTSGLWGSTHECENVLNVEFQNDHRWR